MSAAARTFGVFYMTTLLQIKDLEKTYINKTRFRGTTTVKAVDGVSFGLDKSEVLALVGESGSGKSTVARLILGLERQDGGQILFKGRDIYSQLKQMRASVAAVFQDPYSSLDPRQTVKSIIEEPLIIHNFPAKNRAARVADILHAVGLSNDYLPRYPHEFSGGQRQRIAIARALALGPEVLIADEPTSALDVSVQGQILNLLKTIQKKFKLSILFITHDLAAAKFLSGQIIVMQQGRIVEHGPTENVFARPKTAYTKTLFKAVPTLR